MTRAQRKKPSPLASRKIVTGPKQVRCMVREIATGREVTKAIGNRTAKWTAADRARVNALYRLRRKLGRRWIRSEYELVFVDL